LIAPDTSIEVALQPVKLFERISYEATSSAADWLSSPSGWIIRGTSGSILEEAS
jgi:hypothetical protein